MQQILVTNVRLPLHVWRMISWGCADEWPQLPWSTANEDLVELFETTGHVQQAEILYEGNRSKGMGIVQFEQIDEAETAIGAFSPILIIPLPAFLRLSNWCSFLHYILQPSSRATCTAAGPLVCNSTQRGTTSVPALQRVVLHKYYQQNHQLTKELARPPSCNIEPALLKLQYHCENAAYHPPFHHHPRVYACSILFAPS